MLELNASDDRCGPAAHTVLCCMAWALLCIFDMTGDLLYRGIDVVRNKIKMFAQKKVTLPPGRHKIIILDEADRHVLCPPSQSMHT